MTLTQNIVKEIIVEGYLKAKLYEEGFIEIFWDENLDLIEGKHMSKMQEVVCELGGGKKMPLLFIPHEFVQTNSEGQKYATSDEGVRYSLAIAVLVDNLAKRLLMNFFMKTSKPKVPTKGFSTREDAILWLKKILVEH